MRTLPRCRRGQGRLIETALAALVLFVGLGFVSHLVGPMNTLVVEPRGELERQAYAVLYRLCRARVFERTFVIGDPYWENNVKAVIMRLLPPLLHYNLTVYNATQVDQISAYLEPIASITNLQEGGPAHSQDLIVVSVRAPYTTSSGSVLVLNLALAGMGQVEG